ncbi:hypothetical protein [Gorillibacterium timonense]|uniref:hypothetical protein n=1 Tax=Gorillibacterium timonense TaxID=1689269 RepID=UPI00071DB166|nr:hypothetical protein [Gorillibacterium timonense]
MDKPDYYSLSRQKPATPPLDSRLRDFVTEVSGSNSSRQVFQESRSFKSRMVDEQNKMIDKLNLRK